MERGFTISSLDVEHHNKKNLEFWEEVIEKDYEILSYISKLKNAIISSEDDWINHGDWDIHSVKRLSDGEVFTVGDKLNQPEYECNNSCITSIYIEDNTIVLSDGGIEADFYLKGAIKCPEPLKN